MRKRAARIRFRSYFDQGHIERYVRQELGGLWRNSSGCWDGNYLKLWYDGMSAMTYVHFPCDACYAWEGDVTKDTSKKIKAFIRRLR
jgi:hypothetical protein